MRHSVVSGGLVLCVFIAAAIRNGKAEISGGMLFPRESESRQIQELNGMWNFRTDHSENRNQGFNEAWWSHPLDQTGPVMDMPVPSSYNDISTNKSLQLHVGWVWYEREFYVSKDWASKRIVLRVDSAHYYAIMWVNGKYVTEHVGGHLPFEAEVNFALQYDLPNRVTIAVNNTLSPTTLPPGTVTYHTGDPTYPPGYFTQNLQFDFFNYAGIHRRVRLYTTPKTYVDDITLTTTLKGEYNAYVKYDVGVVGSHDSVQVVIETAGRMVVAVGSGLSGTLHVSKPRLWWPYTMNATDYGFRYIFKVTVSGDGEKDVYRQPFGIRDVAVTSSQLLINGRPFYCHGAAKHEDSDIRGKGLDFALIARDFQMMKWLGANCFRTSHYPYAEEILEQADKQGIVVIDESPGVGITSPANFGNVSLAHHLHVMGEMVRRDKNRPCVILWSVANEPASQLHEADHYFRAVITHTRELDGTRPVTFVCNKPYDKDKVAQYVDILGINRYYGWYSDCGHTEVIPYKLRYDLDKWYEHYKIPLIITEYGADTVVGIHTLPSFVFSEEYQQEFLAQYHSVFDEYRSKFLVGEMVWNFADFMTAQSDIRVDGNKKGLLTRQRQPKMAAHLIRARYWNIINETLPIHGLKP